MFLAGPELFIWRDWWPNSAALNHTLSIGLPGCGETELLLSPLVQGWWKSEQTPLNRFLLPFSSLSLFLLSSFNSSLVLICLYFSQPYAVPISLYLYIGFNICIIKHLQKQGSISWFHFLYKMYTLFDSALWCLIRRDWDLESESLRICGLNVWCIWVTKRKR